MDAGGGGRIVNDGRIGAVAGPATAAKAETGDGGRGQSTAAEQNINKLRNEVAKGRW